MPLYQYNELTPQVAADAMVFEGAVVIGDVRLASGVGVWAGAILRADNDTISVGEDTNIQEAAVLHVDRGHPMHIGARVTIGHQAMLHGCMVEDGAMIGIGATVLNGARIGRDCLIGAGALVPEGREIPARSVVIGVGKVVRTLSDEEVAGIHAGAADYARKARSMPLNLKRL
ncbi:gamma carbonic anhydrase family protein [Caenimonas soli]|uniref:gamma carbonic anhydrase family protein n=1 Tax=Caenimonas soli TaxID=2735555 RepID=UPI001554C033|nr:gamma carbonic anhydrase family protein [Caenimonas soli]NPC58468.1 gamma carbonic anhydrase family protein [Caenimonas soli]